MDMKKLKSLFFAVHTVTKEHTQTKRSYAAWLVARILVILMIVKDHRLSNILRGMLSRSH